MIYRLSFTTKDEWLSVRNTFVLPDEDGNYPSHSIYTAPIGIPPPDDDLYLPVI